MIAGQFQSVDIMGSSANAGLRITHPLEVKFNRQANGSLHQKHNGSATHFSGAKLLEQSVSSVTLGLDMETADASGRGSWSFNNTLSAGFLDADSTRNYVRFNPSFTREVALDNHQRLKLRGVLQLATNDLLPFATQFSLGGISTVRGYPSGHLVGDHGYYLNVETNIPISSTLNTYAFLDHGGAMPYKGNDEPIGAGEYITSMGIGADFTLFKRLSAKLTAGVPLDIQDWPGEVHFAIQWAFP